jgi:predicted ATP-dependent endonuclease of OLD family
MKLQRIKIDNFRHLSGISFDFTYQSGPKKGQPLDKICFIGQSATGKTSVLEFVKIGISGLVDINNKFLDGEIEFVENNMKYTTSKDGISIDGEFGRPMSKNLLNSFGSNILLYFTSDILSPNNFNIITKNPAVPIEQQKIPNAFGIPTQMNLNKQPTKEQKFNQIKSQKILDFNYQTNSAIWEFILDEIAEYRKKLTQKGSELINRGLHQNYTLLEKEMEQWKKDNPNPSIEFANKCLNVILRKLNLQLDLVDTSTYLPLKPINEDKAIPSNALSTGTKQLILNALPLFKLNTDNAIILIDEPERSLYPDIQMELIPYYQSLAPKAQFIVATHSPFIAASFEPEERFILYFDESGKVQVRNGVSPVGDDPNDILKNDFGLIQLMNDMGISAYKKYVQLKQEMANEKDAQKKKDLFKELVLLGDKYKF